MSIFIKAIELYSVLKLFSRVYKFFIIHFTLLTPKIFVKNYRKHFKVLWQKIYTYLLQTDQGIKNLTRIEADRLAGSDPDYATRDLYNAIASGNFPSWSFYIQVMTFEQAESWKFNPFDLTKVRRF